MTTFHATVRPERSEGSDEMSFDLCCERALWPRGASHVFAIAKKVTKNACPCYPHHPPVLATSGMRQRHTNASLTLRTVFARGRIDDRPLLRSSARAEGARTDVWSLRELITIRLIVMGSVIASPRLSSKLRKAQSLPSRPNCARQICDLHRAG